MTTLPLLKQTLEQILSGQTRDSRFALCRNLEKLLNINLGSSLVIYFARSWPIAGCEVYPVGGYIEWSARFANGTLWENPKRIMLVEHCIAQCDVFDPVGFEHFCIDRYGHFPKDLEGLLS